VKPDKSQTWLGYAVSFLAFSSASFVVLYLILRFQDLLPLNPQGFAGCRRTWPSHGRQLRLQHQLAVVRAGTDGLDLRPDGGADLA